AVSSFGISGSNVHTILEAPPAAESAERERPHTPIPWVLSAKTEQALRDQANRLAPTDQDPLDIGYALARRARFERRAVVVGGERDDLVHGLTAIAARAQSAAVVEGVADVDGRTVFVFPGQGAQWSGMGVALLDESPVFA